MGGERQARRRSQKQTARLDGGAPAPVKTVTLAMASDLPRFAVPVVVRSVDGHALFWVGTPLPHNLQLLKCRSMVHVGLGSEGVASAPKTVCSAVAEDAARVHLRRVLAARKADVPVVVVNVARRGLLVHPIYLQTCPV